MPVIFLPVQRIGCYRDTARRAIPQMDGRSRLVRGNYKRRRYAIDLCALVAASKGYKMFAVQDGGWCATGPRAHLTFRRYGKSNRCRNGKGGPWANDAYRVTGDYVKFLGSCRVFLHPVTAKFPKQPLPNRKNLKFPTPITSSDKKKTHIHFEWKLRLCSQKTSIFLVSH